RHSPSEIRRSVLGHTPPASAHLIDHYWSGRAIDCEVGDLLHLPTSTVVEGSCVSLVHDADNGAVARVTQPGLGRVSDASWSSFLRVSRPKFTGRAQFRFHEEIDE